MFFRSAIEYKVVLLLFCVVVLTGCGRDLSLTPHYKTMDLSILPAAAVVVVGSTETFRAYLINEIGESREAESASWWLLEGALGSVESNGTFIAGSTGYTYLYASAEGIVGIAQITVIAGLPVTIEVVPESASLPVGDTLQFTPKAYDKEGHRLPDSLISWEVDGSVLELDPKYSNTVRAASAGNGWVRFSIMGLSQTVHVPVINVPVYEYVTSWAVKAKGTKEVYATGAAIDPSGNIWVTLYDYPDRQIDCVQKYDSTGYLTLSVGEYGTEEGKFNRPNDLVFDSGGNFYVVDMMNNRIQKFGPSGNFLLAWGNAGSGNGEFNNPARLAIDNEDNIYVSDWQGNRVQKFDSDGSFILQWGGYGSSDGQFKNPSGIAVDSGGSVYVADQGNYRIQKFDKNGNYLAKWGSYGGGIGEFFTLVGLTVDSSDKLYIATTNRAHKYDGNGNFITSWGETGSAAGEFNELFDMCVDASGYVYSAESVNKRIQKFRP